MRKLAEFSKFSHFLEVDIKFWQNIGSLLTKMIKFAIIKVYIVKTNINKKGNKNARSKIRSQNY